MSYLLDGKGSGRPLDWQAINSWKAKDGFSWVHLDRTADEAKNWLASESGLDPRISETLLKEARRPRSLPIGDGVLMTLRGVNLNPGARPDDMVALRLWIEPNRAITLRHRHIMAIGDLRDKLEEGQGPKDAQEFLVELLYKLLGRMGPVISNINDQVELLEAEITGGKDQEIKAKLADLHRQAIGLRRYIAPQRDAISDLMIEKVSWLDDDHLGHLRETVNWLSRYLEDLNAARESAKVTQEELAMNQSEQMNRNTYVLTVVAAVMLPASFIAALFGMNFAFLPGADHPSAFVILSCILAVVMIVQILIFRRINWL